MLDLTYGHHENDPIVTNGRKALIYVNRHWQGVLPEVVKAATPMSKDQFEAAFGKLAARLKASDFK